MTPPSKPPLECSPRSRVAGDTGQRVGSPAQIVLTLGDHHGAADNVRDLGRGELGGDQNPSETLPNDGD